MPHNYYNLHYYYVYDLKDNMIICGTVEDICEKLDVTKSCVSKAVKYKRLVRRKYRIYKDTEIIGDI